MRAVEAGQCRRRFCFQSILPLFSLTRSPPCWDLLLHPGCRLLRFSYHGIPERHIKKSDPTKNHCKLDGSCCERNSVAHYTCYRHQCFETTKAIVKSLGLQEGTYSNSFQSRLLKDPWLKPYTDFELEKFPNQGKKKIAVITPAFVSDCLETLEEIAMEGKEDFLEAGGTAYKHIPCMNDNDDWVEVMVSWINKWEHNNNLVTELNR